MTQRDTNRANVGPMRGNRVVWESASISACQGTEVFSCSYDDWLVTGFLLLVLVVCRCVCEVVSLGVCVVCVHTHRRIRFSIV